MLRRPKKDMTCLSLSPLQYHASNPLLTSLPVVDMEGQPPDHVLASPFQLVFRMGPRSLEFLKFIGNSNIEPFGSLSLSHNVLSVILQRLQSGINGNSSSKTQSPESPLNHRL